MPPYDPFDESIEESNRGTGGRPRTRELSDRGAIGRPRIRPIDDPSSRRRGRPQVDPTSIADQIAKEAIVSGQITAKAINSSVQGLQGSIATFQKTVVTPLARTVSEFSQSVSKFNSAHQVYLREQAAIAKDIHESFKLFRRVGVDPILRAGERSHQGLTAVTKIMREINDEKYQGKEYNQMISNLSSIDRKINQVVTAGAASTASIDMYLREYYKTTKGTSKFLNSVTFATEDIAEDLVNLKNDLNKYFKGKNSSRTILQDQTESLRRIESNTKGMGFVVASSVISAITALVKTAFTFNPYLSTDAMTSLFGKSKGVSGKASAYGPLSGIINKFKKSTVAQKAQTTFQESVLQEQPFSEGISRISRRARQGFENLQGLGKSIADAWDHSKVKWFWDIGVKMIADRWERSGAIGVSIVNRMKTNYGRKDFTGPYGGSSRTYWGTQEEAIKGVKKALDKYDKSRGRWGELGEWESDNYAMPEFTKEQFSRLRPKAKDLARPDNVIPGNFNRFATKKSNVVKVDFKKNSPARVTVNPESNNKLTSVETGTAKKALASLNKVSLRILGYLQRMFKHVKHVDENTEDLESRSNKLNNISDKSGLVKFLGGAALAIGGEKALTRYAALRAGWAGKAIGAGAKAKFAKAGVNARMLWDTFGYGNAKKGTGAIAQFKKTKLGQSAIGKALRQLRVINAGFGQGADARIARGLLSANRWGGIFDPLGASAGFLRGAGKARKGTTLLGNTKQSTGFLGKAGQLMDKAGQGIVKGAGKAKGAIYKGAVSAGNWLGGMNKLSNVAKIGASAGFLGGLGKVAGTIFKKIPVIGGLFTLGLGIKELVKDKDWKNGLWHILTGALMAVPATALVGTVLSIGGDVAKFGWNKFKSNKSKQNLDETKAGENAVSEAASASPVINNTLKGAGVEPRRTDSYSGYEKLSSGYQNNNPAKAKRIDEEVRKAKEKQNKPKYGFFGKAAASAKAGLDKIAGKNQSSNTPASASNGAAENSPYINWNGQQHSHLLPEFSSKLAAAAEDYYKATNKKLVITSGERSNQKQAELFARKHALGDTSISNNVARPTASTTINYKGKQYWVRGKDNGNIRTGHTVGGAVDVADANTFKQFAVAQGLTWGGSFDPTDKMHFQVNTKAPVIGSAAPVKTPPADAIKVGDMNTEPGPSPVSHPTIQGPSAVAPTAKPNASPTVEISPIIQDYGLAIVNNLLFS